MKVFHKHVCKLLLFLWVALFGWMLVPNQIQLAEAAADSIQVNVVKQRLRENSKIQCHTSQIQWLPCY